MEAVLNPQAPPAHERLRGSGYGGVLGLILLSLGFQLGAPDDEWARLVTLFLQTATLLAALHVSGVRQWVLRVATVISVVACLSAVGIVIGSGELGVLSTRAVGLMLVVLAPAAILAGMVRHYRHVSGVTFTTIFAVLCIYLLSGMAFAFIYGLIAEIDSKPFFANGSSGDQADFLYFSFTTMTTTGYGDFTAAQGFGRAIAITEQLFGQIYLVTVVALIVGNLGRRPAIRQ